LANEHHEKEKEQILSLKKYLKEQLVTKIPGVVFNGDPDGESLYTVLSVGFPLNDKTEMLLFNLDIRNICASGGSACSSGANQGSHVIAALNKAPQSTIRFSFSKYNKKEDIDTLISNLLELI
jgi:cysteine desulfurase